MAAANSFNVSNKPGAESTKSASAVLTYAVLASWLLLTVCAAVSDVG